MKCPRCSGDVKEIREPGRYSAFCAACGVVWAFIGKGADNEIVRLR